VEPTQADELNRFREIDAGKNWGYPECWTEFDVPDPFGQGQGTVWAWPTFLEQGEASDDTCRATTVASVMALQAHSAPLGIAFYSWKRLEERPPTCPEGVGFPQEMDGYAFMAYHGSWNREVPTGYKVVYLGMDGNGDPITANPVDLLEHEPPNAQWDDGFRPVDVSFDDCGRLLVSSYGTGGSGSKIVRIESTSTNLSVSAAPSIQTPRPPMLANEKKQPEEAKCGPLMAGARGGAGNEAKGCSNGRRGNGNTRRRGLKGL